jgi:hypothetical protein
MMVTNKFGNIWAEAAKMNFTGESQTYNIVPFLIYWATGE